MIQDILPYKFNIAFKHTNPKKDDYVLIFSNDNLLIDEKDGFFDFPTIEKAGISKENLQYLFQIDEKSFFMSEYTTGEFESFKYHKQEDFREYKPIWKSFAALTAAQLHRWYGKNKFCSCCGNKLIKSSKERALVCPSCKNTLYPIISPSVIVAVTDGNKILLTKYAPNHSSYKKFALIAGYVETGETLEETVKREVMEEVGLKVKNITYYKSQPWALSDSLLMGFFCELDGENNIVLEEDELSCAK